MKILRGTLLLLLSSLAAPAVLSAQAVPVTGPLQFCGVGSEPGSYSCGWLATTVLTDGRFVAAGVWDYWNNDLPFTDDTFAWFDLLDPAGRFVGGGVLASGNPLADNLPGMPSLAADASGGFVAAWQMGIYMIQARRFGRSPASEDPLLLIEDQETHWGPRIAANAQGRFVVAWHSSSLGWLTPESISVRAFDSADQPATPRIRLVAQDASGFLEQPRIAIDGQGRFTVLWKETTRATGAVVLRGQRFGRAGRPLGSTFDLPRVGLPAFLPGGGIAVAGSEDDGGGLWLETFGPDGGSAGSPVAVTSAAATPLDLTRDRHGNLALFWREGDLFWVRLFNRDLVPQGARIPIRITDPRTEEEASVSLSDRQRLLVAWTSKTPEMEMGTVFARLWKVSYDADACVRRSGRFLCDTAGDGGEAEAAIDFGSGQRREIPFLADWDGDGRDDPCLYRGRSFSCDTDHDGGLAEAVSPRLGLAGDVPLLGDLDGDGRADPCVRRGRLLLCDRARDGGATDVRIDFGQPGETLLLGDVDGDGRDDPCLYKGRRFLCDTAHDGGAAEVVLDLRSAVTAAAGGVPLLGDVNGDGRGDACVWQAGRLVCGVFQARGGQPLRTIERDFGEAGDIPLLGDLDAF